MTEWINQARRESITPEQYQQRRETDKVRRQTRTPEQKRRQAEADKKWRLANSQAVKRMHKDYYERNRELIAQKNKARRLSRAAPKENSNE